MASERTPAPKQGKRLRKFLFVLAGALLLLIALATWLLGTASGARAVFDIVASTSNDSLRAEGVHGRVAGPLRVERLTVNAGDSHLTLSDLRLDWRPLALLDQQLHLTSLRIGHLAVRTSTKESPEPSTLPESIALPLTLHADDVQVDSAEINRGPVTLAKLGPLALGLDFNGARYQLQLRRFSVGATPEQGKFATRINGQATLSTTRPYALQGRFSGESNASFGSRAIGADGTIELGGSLAELIAAVHVNVNQARVEGSATLWPFTAQPLGKAQLTARALDLSRLDAGLPHSVLDIDLLAAEDGAGTLRVRNADAGTYDERKMPLSSLDLAFRQAASQWHVDRLDASLGTVKHPAGKLTGRGRLADGAITLSLHTDALDLRRLDRRARATQLKGELDLRHADGKQAFSLSLSEPLHSQRLTLEARGALADAQLSIERFDLRAGSGRIDASGKAQFNASQAFDAKAQVSHFRLRELGDFPQLPELDLTGSFSLHGKRQPELEADLKFDITDSSLAGQPLVGNGEAALRGERLKVPRFSLASGANRLHIEGQLSEGDAQLSFMLNAPQLRQLGAAFGGALQANGSVRGSLIQARINAQWNASQARLPGAVQIDAMQGKADVAIDRKQAFPLNNVIADVSARGLRHGENRLANVAAQLRFSPQPNAPLSMSIRADGIRTGRLIAERFSATANGTTARHAIDLALNETGQSWSAKASGGLSAIDSDAHWKGSIDAFVAGGRFDAGLASPSPLFVSAQRVQLDRFVLESGSGRIAVEQFKRDDAGIATRGHIASLQLARLLQAAAPAAQVRTDLLLGGEWDVRIGDTPSGTLALRREGGDVTVLGNSPFALGLRTLDANATINNGRLAVQMRADGQRLGHIDLNAATVIGDGDNRMGIAPDAPVSGSARIDVPSLAWLGPMISPNVTLDGVLRSEIAVGGTFGQPRLAGKITGDALKLAMTGIGLDLRQGVLDSDFEGNRLVIRQLSFLGTEGRASLSGPIDFGEGKFAAQLALRAERFALLNRADRRIVVSGDSRLDWRDQLGKLAGAFTVDSGFIDLGRADKPQLSDDVVIVGQEKKQAAKTALALDIALSLGEGVKVVGRGLDAVLGGQIKLMNDAGEALQAQGTFHVIKGTYSAYGKELAIEQGGLRFRGPISNPSLDILAMRRGQEVEAGVAVRGNVLAPRITLVSEPTVPDAEKLSWLVLGRGLSSAGASDAGALQAAAAALLSEGAKAGVQSRIASAFGLDTFNVGTSQDTLQQRIVTLGKQISSKLYVSYQQGLENAGSVIQLRYTLSPKLSVEAEAGTRSAISLFYNLAFD